MQFRATTNGAFGKVLAERRAKWAGGVRAAARIRTSAEIAWWYYQEFGTAPYTMKPDPLGVFHDQWAAIWRLNAAAMVFTIDGQNIITTRVPHHPGIPARHMVRNALPLFREKAIERLKALAPHIPDNPELLRQFVLDSASDAKEAIRDSFELSLSNHSRPDGRLQGRSAAQAFEENSTIVPTE